MYDYIYDWMVKVIHATYPAASLLKIMGEIDTQFSQLPPYPGIRHFREGVSAMSRWTGNKYKKMAQVLLGVVRSLIPPMIARLIRVYLGILRLSLYVSHSESTKNMLDKAVKDFLQLQNDPHGPLIEHGVIQEGWYCPKSTFSFITLIRLS